MDLVIKISQYQFDISFFIIMFSIYSFAGWVIEVLYRSFQQRKFINPGFLFGSFVPIYGIGALFIIYLYPFISKYCIFVEFLIYGVILTTIEFLIGEFSERFFGLTLWDYNDTRFNFKGKVSLPFSITWATLAYLLVTFFHPLVNKFILSHSDLNLDTLTLIILIYFIIDFSFSLISLNVLQRRIRDIYFNYVNFSNKDMNEVFIKFKRIFNAFPNLKKTISDSTNHGIKINIGELLLDTNKKFKKILRDNKQSDKEYYSIIQDILANDEFLKLKNFYHHNSSIYDHSLKVSYLSYLISKKLKFDYVSAARGGLLHDFFLYDWRNHDLPELAKNKYHGLEHPKIALKNSMDQFELSKIEKDIIIKHMWPLTILPPRYKESFVVTFVDKYIASKESIVKLKKKSKKEKK